MNNLKNLRKSKRLTQQKLGQKFDIADNTLSQYETGQRQIPDELKIKLADYFDVTVDYLLGRVTAFPSDNILERIGATSLKDIYPIPVLGKVIAGVPLMSEENFDGYIYTDKKPAENYFALKVFGDSMIGAGITEGSILIVRRQSEAQSGEIVVALLNGDEATVKRYKITQDGTRMLVPENKDFDPIIMNGKNQAQIIGVVEEIRTKVK